jgi:hypothetical protein
VHDKFLPRERSALVCQYPHFVQASIFEKASSKIYFQLIITSLYPKMKGRLPAKVIFWLLYYVNLWKGVGSDIKA